MIKSQWRNESEGIYQEVGKVTSSNPASIATDAVGTATLAIPNITAKDTVFLTSLGLVAGLVLQKAVITEGVVTLHLQNVTAGAIDDAASDWNYHFIANSIS